MFESLIEFSPPIGFADDEPMQEVDDASIDAVVAAQQASADWLEEVGVPPDATIDAKQQVQAARDAFGALTTVTTQDAQKVALAKLKSPQAVQHLTGMLALYDWDFVEQAKELRGFVVAKILEETSHPDARIRLRALQMLGNVTEIASFTERVEVTKVDASEQEVEARLRERLSKYLKKDVQEAQLVSSSETAVAPDVVAPEALDEEIAAIALRRDSQRS